MPCPLVYSVMSLVLDTVLLDSQWVNWPDLLLDYCFLNWYLYMLSYLLTLVVIHEIGLYL